MGWGGDYCLFAGGIRRLLTYHPKPSKGASGRQGQDLIHVFPEVGRRKGLVRGSHLRKGKADLGPKTDSGLEMLGCREGLIAFLEKLGWAYQPVFLREKDMIMFLRDSIWLHW